MKLERLEELKQRSIASGNMNYSNADLLQRLRELSPLFEWSIADGKAHVSLTMETGTISAHTPLSPTHDPMPLHLEAQRISRIIGDLIGQKMAGYDVQSEADYAQRLLSAIQKQSAGIQWRLEDDQIVGSVEVGGKLFSAQARIGSESTMPIALDVQRVQMTVGPTIGRALAEERL